MTLPFEQSVFCLLPVLLFESSLPSEATEPCTEAPQPMLEQFYLGIVLSDNGWVSYVTVSTSITGLDTWC